MPSESITAAGRAAVSELKTPLGPASLAFVALIASLLVILAIPFSAKALQPSRPDEKASFKQLPVAPAGASAGLPYETRPAPQQQSPLRHGGPDAFGYIYDDEGETGSGVVY